MKKLFLFVAAVCLLLKVQSQVSDASQLLKIHNITNTTNLNNISNPTSGNVIFLNSDDRIYVHNGTSWEFIGGNTSGSEAKNWLEDNDKDTHIKVDNGVIHDDDEVDFTTAGTHSFNFSTDGLQFVNSNGSVNIANTNSNLLNIFAGIDAGKDAIHVDGSLTDNGDNNGNNNNIVFGAEAYKSHGDGINNVAMGFQSMGFRFSLNHGSSGPNHNIALGVKTFQYNTWAYQNQHDYGFDDSRNIALGYKALEAVNGTNSFIGRSNIAIGYKTMANTENINNPSPPYMYTPSMNNVFIGSQAGFGMKRGHGNVGIGYRGEYLDIALASWGYICIIGNEDTQYASMQVAWSNSSDSTFKRDIKPIEYGLNLINKIEPVDYIRKTKGQTKEMGREMGFIAQNLDKKLKDIGYDEQGFVSKGKHYSVRYADFIPLAIQGIQEQQKEIDNLQEENKQLKQGIQKRQKLINELKKELKNEVSKIKDQLKKINR